MHYRTALESEPVRRTFDRGPIHQLPPDFCVFEIPPCEQRDVWVYASCGMSFDNSVPIEVYVFSPRQAPELIELLYVMGHFHINGEALDEQHTVNFGRPWMQGSSCQFGLLSTMDSHIDWGDIDGQNVHFLWLIPITEAERDFKIEFGLSALDRLFEEKSVDCTDPLRASAA